MSAFAARARHHVGFRIGAALLLITRTVEPRRVYDEVDWGLLVFFVGLFIIVAGAERAGLTARLLQPLVQVIGLTVNQAAGSIIEGHSRVDPHCPFLEACDIGQRRLDRQPLLAFLAGLLPGTLSFPHDRTTATQEDCHQHGGGRG